MNVTLIDAAFRKGLSESAERRRVVDTALREAGIYGLLSEIIGRGALAEYGDEDLLYRVKLAIADHESAVKKAQRARLEEECVQGAGTAA
jgi:hypothetical protein